MMQGKSRSLINAYRAELAESRANRIESDRKGAKGSESERIGARKHKAKKAVFVALGMMKDVIIRKKGRT